jgi:glucan phosphoethanolaminetransferase (alkaline phosphatase superfamily)
MKPQSFFEEYKVFFWSHLSREELRKRYMRNLFYVLGACNSLVNLLHGTTIITSDHGEALGELDPFPFRVYGHYEDVRTKKMYEVPYFILDK